MMSLRLDRFDILRPWSFWTPSLGKRDLLSLIELFEAHAFKTGSVEEHVLSGRRVDESEAFVREFLDRAFCHFLIDSKSVNAALPDTTGSGCSATSKTLTDVENETMRLAVLNDQNYQNYQSSHRSVPESH
jgi:hypothetical protein